MKNELILILCLFLFSCAEESSGDAAKGDSSETVTVDTFRVGGDGETEIAVTDSGKFLREENDSFISEVKTILRGTDADGEEEVVSTEQIVRNPDVAPSFPGGENEMQKFIRKHLVYPLVAFQNEIEGAVQVSFVVEPNGTIGGIKVLRSLGYGCDEAAVDMIRSMPVWNPGKKGGIAVRCSVTLPVYFGK